MRQPHKIGLVTIGQSPREDVTRDIAPILGPGFQLLEAGALDSLTPREIEQLAPGPGEYVLVSRLRDGSWARMGESRLLPLLQNCITRLEGQGVSQILLLCSGQFPQPFRCSVPLLLPGELLSALVPILAPGGRLLVVTPDPLQREQCRRRWQPYAAQVTVACASPYQNPEELEVLAASLRGSDAQLLVLDCIGYTSAMKDLFARRLGIPVLLPRTLLAQVVRDSLPL